MTRFTGSLVSRAERKLCLDSWRKVDRGFGGEIWRFAILAIFANIAKNCDFPLIKFGYIVGKPHFDFDLYLFCDASRCTFASSFILSYILPGMLENPLELAIFIVFTHRIASLTFSFFHSHIRAGETSENRQEGIQRGPLNPFALRPLRSAYRRKKTSVMLLPLVLEEITVFALRGRTRGYQCSETIL